MHHFRGACLQIESLSLYPGGQGRLDGIDLLRHKGIAAHLVAVVHEHHAHGRHDDQRKPQGDQHYHTYPGLEVVLAEGLPARSAYQQQVENHKAEQAYEYDGDDIVVALDPGPGDDHRLAVGHLVHEMHPSVLLNTVGAVRPVRLHLDRIGIVPLEGQQPAVIVAGEGVFVGDQHLPGKGRAYDGGIATVAPVCLLFHRDEHLRVTISAEIVEEGSHIVHQAVPGVIVGEMGIGGYGLGGRQHAEILGFEGDGHVVIPHYPPEIAFLQAAAYAGAAVGK